MSFYHKFQWFCSECYKPRSNIPTLNNLTAADQLAFRQEWYSWQIVNVCCSRLVDDCTCTVPITQQFADDHYGQRAYSAYADCDECVHFASFSCAPYREYLRAELDGQYPPFIVACENFVWADTSTLLD